MNPRKSADGPQTEPHDIPEEVRGLRDAVNGLASEVRDSRDHLHIGLTGIQDVMEDLRSLLEYVVNNREEFVLGSMAKDPTDPKWAEKLNRPRQDVVCLCCENSVSSLAEAVRAEWKHLQEDKKGLPWRWIGECDSCFKGPARAEEEGTYCCPTPKLEWSGDPDNPSVACSCCGYVVADCGSLVVRHEDDKPKKEPQKTLF